MLKVDRQPGQRPAGGDYKQRLGDLGQGRKSRKNRWAIISFAYDATGNRISKKVQGDGQDRITYYVRDASGNVMAN